jgi:LuxR family transcriptional regulator, quorum-sensing system regulator BjaR1
MRSSSARPVDPYKSAARGIQSALAEAKDFTELDRIFAARIERLGFANAGYIRVFGDGHFHGARFCFGGTVPGWAERYQSERYFIDDPVVTDSCRRTGAFTLADVAGPSRRGAQILADSRKYGLYDGFVTPIRSGFDEVGLVLVGTDRRLALNDYERFLLQGMCETYARAGLALLAPSAVRPSLSRRESECLRWVAVGRSDAQIGMILGLSPNTVHAHIEAAKAKLDANSRVQLVLRAVMAGILRSDPPW